ncbi:MAG: phage holin family protein [Lachnospiraceae bacterium]|nr:phage holin family protein [Lachnospiraceae bacterium]
MERNRDWPEYDGSGPDYKELNFGMRRVFICVVILIIGIVMLVVSKGDIAFILVGIAMIVIAGLLFRIARKGIKKAKEEGENPEKPE